MELNRRGAAMSGVDGVRSDGGKGAAGPLCVSRKVFSTDERKCKSDI